jgi:hypothetical protein
MTLFGAFCLLVVELAAKAALPNAGFAHSQLP